MFIAFKTKVNNSRYTGLSDEFLIGSNADVKATYEEWIGLDEAYCAGYAKVISSRSMDGDYITNYENPLSDEPLGSVFVVGKNNSSGIFEYSIFLDYDSETHKDTAIGMFNEKVAKGVNSGEQVFVAILLEGTDWDVEKASTYREGKSYS